MSAAPTFAPRQRARFDALKRQMFAEMGCAVARFRLAWIIPFNLMVIAVLALTGMSSVRLGIEIVALFGSAIVFKMRLHSIQRVTPRPQRRTTSSRRPCSTSWVSRTPAASRARSS